MYMDDIKLFAKKYKRIGELDTKNWIYTKDIGIEFDFEKGDMFIMKGRKKNKQWKE